MKQMSSKLRFREMGLSQFNIINDLSSNYEYFYYNSCFAKEVLFILFI
jgi:hypothetical protein